MPFTPFHFGPGMAMKAAMGRHFSLVAFGAAQVAMDIEPLLHMLRGDARLHGFTHTWLGALLVGAVAWPGAKLLYPPLAAVWNAGLDGPRFAIAPRVDWMPAAVGAFAGTLSHVVLDAVMHADMTPFAPFAAGNPWLHALSIETLHLACVAAGVFGFAAWTLRAAMRR